MLVFLPYRLHHKNILRSFCTVTEKTSGEAPNLDGIVLEKALSVPKTTFKAKVRKIEANMRLDNFIKKRVPEYETSLIKKLLTERKISVTELDATEPTKRRLEMYTILKEGQVVWLPLKETIKKDIAELPAKHLDEDQIEKIKAMVVHKDKHILAINKPAGLATQGGSGISQHVDAMLEHLKFGYPEKPRLVHRLDKEASGVLLLARTKESAIQLQKLIMGRENIEKNYLAWVLGDPTYHRLSDPKAARKGVVFQRSGSVKVQMVEDTRYGTDKMIVVPKATKGSQVSVTDYEVIDEPSKMGTLMQLHPVTGRKHQLRVVCSSVFKTPIYGDEKYGDHKKDAIMSEYVGMEPKMHLHSFKTIFKHPFTDKNVTIKAPLPDYFLKTLFSFQIEPPK
eukprot:TRINITY_DN520_c0_g1_i2.p1 TRINITY_DN520_c0_g1~~TRINITY_DN520_c0_g1_i2.p1  ORF type:complete len:395 (+),score=76.01 TRINITY_DN520_c0_g1_i2:78-1262(+)